MCLLSVKLLLITSLLVSVSHLYVLDSSGDNIIVKCNLSDTDFWDTLSWNFQNSSVVSVIQLVTKYSESIIGEFVSQMLLNHASLGARHMSFYLKKYKLISKEILKKLPTTENCVQVLLPKHLEFIKSKKPGYWNLPTTTVHEFMMQQRILRFSADFNYAFHLIVWDDDDLKLFIKKRSKKVFPDPRGIYMVAFISSTSIDMKNIEELFRLIWTEHAVLNIIFQIPCTCNRKNLYMYDPFEFSSGKWGKVRLFQIEQAKGQSEKYRNSLRNLKSYPLQISLFPRLPTALNIFPEVLSESKIYKNLSRSKGYAGLDGMVMGTLAEWLNFEAVLLEHETDYGFETNGTYFGSVGDVVYRRADISFNTRFVDGFGGDLVEYLTPVINDKFCLVVPKAQRIPQWLSIFRCFDLKCWFVILSFYVFASIYWYIVQPARFPINSGRKYRTSIDSFFDIFALFLSAPIQLATTNNHRMFLISCMVFNIIITGAFQGSLVKSFSTISYYHDINSLEEFDKSGLVIHTSSRSTTNVFGDDGTELMKKLSKKIQLSTRNKLIKQVAFDRNVATFERLADARLRMILYFPNEDKVHICQECPRSYYFTYIVPKGSPYTHVFNIVITMLREAGLITKWNSDIVDVLILDTLTKSNHYISENRKFSLEDLQIPFFFLIAGFVISGIVFLFEINIIHKL